jgi:hypothetical protein
MFEKKHYLLSVIVQGKVHLSYPIPTTGGVELQLLSLSFKIVEWNYDALF